MSEKAQTRTRKIRIVLGALTRVEYSEGLEVPSCLSRGDLDRLVEERYQDVDGGDFYPDDHYWERGECFLEKEPSNVPATTKIALYAEGDFVLVCRPAIEEA